jgi:hypothetical protein
VERKKQLRIDAIKRAAPWLFEPPKKSDKKLVKSTISALRKIWPDRDVRIAHDEHSARVVVMMYGLLIGYADVEAGKPAMWKDRDAKRRVSLARFLASADK